MWIPQALLLVLLAAATVLAAPPPSDDSCTATAATTATTTTTTADSAPMAASAAAAAASSSATRHTAAVLGATGAVGGQVLKVLCSRPEQWSRVVLVSRRVIPDDKLPAHDGVEVTQLTVDMTDPEALRTLAAEALSGTDAAFITMGVGAASKATHEQLEMVDVTLPTAFAAGAREAGTRYAAVLTAVGADAEANPDSLLGRLLGTSAGGPFYARCKGRVEANLGALGFDTVAAYRPAALIGTPHTPKLIAWIQPFLDKIVSAKWAGSDINTLASAMVFEAEQALARPAAAVAGSGDGDGAPAAPAGSTTVVREGEALQALYRALPFANGLGEV